MAKKHVLTEKDLPLINKMIANWKTDKEIIRHYHIATKTFYNFKKRMGDKLGKRDWSYTLTDIEEKSRKDIIKAYKKRYYKILASCNLNPDICEIESLLSMDTIICACKFDRSKHTKYTTYCIQKFGWTFKKYKCDLEKLWV